MSTAPEVPSDISDIFTRCTALTATGTPCQHPAAVASGGFCVQHRPGAARGGRPRKATAGALEVDLSTQQTVAETLDRVGKAVANRTLNAAAGNTLARVCDLALKALDQDRIKRLEALEARMRETNPNLMPRVGK